MTRYKTIFEFNVMDEIARGEEVYMIDRREGVIDYVSNMSFGDVANAIKGDNSDNRFEFYKVVED